MSSTKFTQGHLIKIDWLVTNVTTVRSPDRAGGAIFGAFFLPIQAVFVVWELLCDIGTPSWALTTLHKAI